MAALATEIHFNTKALFVSSLVGVRVCLFDAYGTLFDFASAAARCAAIPEEKRAALTSRWREKQLQYAWLRTLQGRYVDFWQVTNDALVHVLDTLNLRRPGLSERLMQLYCELEAYPEVPGVIQQLRRAGFITAILSNGTAAMLQTAISGAGLAGQFDAVLSVDQVGVFKTHPKVYQYALDSLGVAASAISFQSSNAWDAYAASDFGMRVVWCNRNRECREQLPGTPDHEICTLAELPPLLLYSKGGGDDSG